MGDCQNGNACPLCSFPRNNYFYGKLLTVRDFKAEQRYFIEKNKYENRLIHGFGIICGLKVSEARINKENNNLEIYLGKGAALDHCGNLIVVSEDDWRNVGKPRVGNNFIYLSYEETEGEPVPALANNCCCNETCCNGRVLESFEVACSDNPPNNHILELSGDTWEDREPNYIKEKLHICPQCYGDKVFIAAVHYDGKNLTLDDKDCAIVYTNPLLHALMNAHFADTSNPHNTTAAQVKALKTVNNIGNKDTETNYVSNINLVCDEVTNKTIDISQEGNDTIAIKLAAGSVQGKHLATDSVERKHFNEEVINYLLVSNNDTISIGPNSSENKINIQTNPADPNEIQSIGSKKSAGDSKHFAPANHVHDFHINKVSPDQNGQILLVPPLHELRISVTESSAAPTARAGVVKITIPASENLGTVMVNPGFNLPYFVNTGLEIDNEDGNKYIENGSPVYIIDSGQVFITSRAYIEGAQKGKFEITAKCYRTASGSLTHVEPPRDIDLNVHWIAVPAVYYTPTISPPDGRKVLEPPFGAVVLPALNFVEKANSLDNIAEINDETAVKLRENGINNILELAGKKPEELLSGGIVPDLSTAEKLINNANVVFKPRTIG